MFSWPGGYRLYLSVRGLFVLLTFGWSFPVAEGEEKTVYEMLWYVVGGG
jgi:hypothetical protein